MYTRTPRKSSSFLSLRREKDRQEPPPTAYNSPVASSSTSPNSYFDVYPRHKSASLGRSIKNRIRGASISKSSPPPAFSPPLYSEPDPIYTDTSPNTYAFPSFDPTSDFTAPSPSSPTNGTYQRTRSRTGPSGKPPWQEPEPAVPQLRFSISSSTQHTETPPRTPDDYRRSIDSLTAFPDLVAAPISGVETMDALVDGMNGGDGFIAPRRSAGGQSRFGIPNHHPLYQPPLPTPPPGVVLGGGKARKKLTRKTSMSEDSSSDDAYSLSTAVPRNRRRHTRPTPSRSASAASTVVSPPSPQTPPASYGARSVDNHYSPPSPNPPPPTLARRPTTASALERRKSIVPSISEIIRNHALPEAQTRSRPATIRSTSMYSPSIQSHATVHEEAESEPEPLTREEEAELLSRSSIDSVADEVQRTIRNQSLAKPLVQQPPPLPPAPPAQTSSSAFMNRQSVISDNSSSIYSPRSDPGVAPSLYSVSAPSSYLPPSPLETTNFLSMVKNSPSHAVAQYLRSARLTTLLKLTRSPHASQDNPLTVSLSDLGSPSGYPVVVFLGLGCVRHIMGLYDEMAECMGLRLITIDRWGLGRTEPRSKSAKGIMQWASVVEEVLDLLHIGKVSVMAHSAGAPYALSFANKLPSRIRGDICLLAPWVGGSEGSGSYKWLKYVPNSILKTAQAAEWKIQAWMIGKPPTIAYEGIGYTAPPVPKSTNSSRRPSPVRQTKSSNGAYVVSDGRPRPSVGSGFSSFSEYDDLGDFDGRFESRSTLGSKSRPSSQYGHNLSQRADGNIYVAKRKTSRGILERLKGASINSPSIPAAEKDKEKSSGGKKLKGLRSMGSLRSKNSASAAAKSEPSSPRLPDSLAIDVGLGLEDMKWMNNSMDSSLPTPVPHVHTPPKSHSRSSGRRSISFTSSKSPQLPIPSSPSPSTFTTSFVPPGQPDQNGANGSSSSHHQVALGNALIAASHAESAHGTHNDLLQILNHENHSWGFSYAAYPHKVRVWYGDRDEKIAENAVRWMERTMGPEKCSVKVVKGADHGLMYRSSAVVDVLEWVVAAWRSTDRAAQPYSALC